jgi:hypothetical protein
MKLKSYKDKMKILKETNRLKGSNIYVNEDFSKMTVDIRKRLFAEVKERRLNGENLAVRYDKIIYLKNAVKYSSKSTK